jgi:cytochrome c oxidase cbb3-type subunit 3
MFILPPACDRVSVLSSGSLKRRRPSPLSLTVALMLPLTLALALTACTTADDAGVAVPVEPARIYAQNCARCHGLDGRGDAEIKKTMPVRDFTDRAWLAQANSDNIARTIMGGKNLMPAFGGALSPPKIQALSGYVKRLHQTGPNAAPTPASPQAPSAASPQGASPKLPPGGAAAPAARAGSAAPGTPPATKP